jgi:hypothetical protein
MTPKTILVAIAILITTVSFFAAVPWQVPALLLGVAMLLP